MKNKKLDRKPSLIAIGVALFLLPILLALTYVMDVSTSETRDSILGFMTLFLMPTGLLLVLFGLFSGLSNHKQSNQNKKPK